MEGVGWDRNRRGSRAKSLLTGGGYIWPARGFLGSARVPLSRVLGLAGARRGGRRCPLCACAVCRRWRRRGRRATAGEGGPRQSPAAPPVTWELGEERGHGCRSADGCWPGRHLVHPSSLRSCAPAELGACPSARAEQPPYRGRSRAAPIPPAAHGHGREGGHHVRTGMVEAGSRWPRRVAGGQSSPQELFCPLSPLAWSWRAGVLAAI